jgi:hypothetical protein
LIPRNTRADEDAFDARARRLAAGSSMHLRRVYSDDNTDTRVATK